MPVDVDTDCFDPNCWTRFAVSGHSSWCPQDFFQGRANKEGGQNYQGVWRTFFYPSTLVSMPFYTLRPLHSALPFLIRCEAAPLNPGGV